MTSAAQGTRHRASSAASAGLSCSAPTATSTAPFTVWARSSVPAEYIGDLRGEGEGVKGLEEHSLDAEVGEAALVGALHLGGKQHHRDVSGGGIAAQFAKGCGAIHSGHHDVEKNGVGLLLDGLLIPASGRIDIRKN